MTLTIFQTAPLPQTWSQLGSPYSALSLFWFCIVYCINKKELTNSKVIERKE